MSFLPHLALGCAVCFGDPNALSSRALVLAVFFLGAVIVSVLGGIGWTAFAWSRRAKSLEAGD